MVPQPTCSARRLSGELLGSICVASNNRQEVPEGEWFCEVCEALRLEGWQLLEEMKTDHKN